jgi:hypothetical protein
MPDDVRGAEFNHQLELSRSVSQELVPIKNQAFSG